jgi:hypothetical protein
MFPKNKELLKILLYWSKNKLGKKKGCIKNDTASSV